MAAPAERGSVDLRGGVLARKLQVARQECLFSRAPDQYRTAAAAAPRHVPAGGAEGSPPRPPAGPVHRPVFPKGGPDGDQEASGRPSAEALESLRGARRGLGTLADARGPVGRRLAGGLGSARVSS